MDEFDWERGTEDFDRITGLEGSAARALMLRHGNACLELFEFSFPTPRPRDAERPVCDHGITHLCLDVTDIAAKYERLSKDGMRFHSPPQAAGEGFRCAYGRDPDGNVVELQEMTRREDLSYLDRGD